MKRRDLVNRLEELGYIKVRSGANHDIYSNGKRSEPVPRHNEINELTAQMILKRAEESKG